MMKKFFKLSVYIFVATTTVSLQPTIEIKNKTAYTISLFAFKEMPMSNSELYPARVKPKEAFVTHISSNEPDMNLTPDLNSESYTIYIKQGQKAVITMDEKSAFDGIYVSYDRCTGQGSYILEKVLVYCTHDKTIIIEDEVRIRYKS